MKNFDKDTLILIEQYIAGELEGDELIDFEIKISLDPDLQKEIEFQQLLNKAIRFGRKKQLKQYITENASTRLSGNIWGRTWTLVSTVIVAVTFILFIISEFVIGNNEDVKNNVIEAPVPVTVQKPQTDLSENDTTELDTDTVFIAEPMQNRTAEPAVVKTKIPKENITDTIIADDTFEIIDNVVTFANDSIKRERLIKEVSFFASVADSIEFFQNKKVRKRASVADDNSGSNIKVEFWQSPVNYRGYKYENNKLVIYGVSTPENIQLRYINNRLYLKDGNQYYYLTEQKNLTSLVPVQISDPKRR